MKRLVAILIVAAYARGLRRWVNDWQRKRAEADAPREPLLRFATPEDAVSYARSRWVHRDDKIGGLPYADWSSHPEVTQHRITNRATEHGDCDDFHGYIAAALALIPGVSDIVLISEWTWSRGHTTCAYRYEGELYHVDYEIRPIESLGQALDEVRVRYKWKAALAGWVFETPQFELIATYPNMP